MDLEFQKNGCPFLREVICQTQTAEQTQELRLSDGMPDIGRVLAAWGQPVLRGKEWAQDSIVINGGILVWVLYAPEDGTEARCVDTWLPFTVKMDLPEECGEGKLRVQLLSRACDARSLSSRKLMVRASTGVLVQACCRQTEEVWTVKQPTQEAELLVRKYPVRIRKELGEKTLVLDEELTLPGSAPVPEKLVYYTLSPQITDRKVISDKVVCKGNGNLHLLYRSEEGQFHSWDFPLPFSQYMALEEILSEQAGADVMLCVTGLELELDPEGHLRLKASMTAQYLADDVFLAEVVEDAYSPGRELKLSTRTLGLWAVLDSRKEVLQAQQTIPANMNLAADLCFLPDFPRIYPGGRGLRLEVPGVFQILYYDENGALQGGAGRWEGSRELAGQNTARLSALPQFTAQPQLSLSESAVTMKCELPLAVTAISLQQIPMITGVEEGEVYPPDPQRPSLILRRSDGRDLWELAKESGSTVSAICRANALEGEPEEGRMLLIPIA